MKILIGTPIHEVKDYAMERWLQNVAKLEYPADLLMVDNSPGLDYMETVKGYCKKRGLNPVRNLSRSPTAVSNGTKNYKLDHLEVNQEDQSVDERIGRSIEIIRQEILAEGYDAWFSWECDQLIPNNALGKLIKMMESGNFMIASHNTRVRENPGQVLDELFGTTLIKREVFKKHGFLLEFGTNPEMPDTWEPGEKWFKKQVLRDGGSTIEADGVLKPVYHLNE